jgi:hypothetical protein
VAEDTTMSNHVPVNVKGLTVLYEGQDPTVEYVVFPAVHIPSLLVLDSN